MIAQQQGTSLIFIPCWWDGELDRFDKIIFIISFTIGFCIYFIFLVYMHPFTFRDLICCHQKKIIVKFHWTLLLDSLNVFISFIYCHVYSILIYYIFILKIKASEIPGVGELMAASFPMDPKFNESFPENTWY